MVVRDYLRPLSFILYPSSFILHPLSLILAPMSCPETIRSSYKTCRRMVRQAGSNFPAAFLLLPAAQHRAMDALYAFMRHSDDLVDDPDPARPAAEALTRWRAAVEAALDCPRRASPPTGLDIPGDPLGAAILPALAHTVRAFSIPQEHLLAVLEGVAMDLSQRRYATFEQLQTYCQRVASAVGLACIHVWGFSDPQALGPARSAGIALQLTNILRDLKEDAQRDRVYLPLEDLRRCGYSIDELCRSAVTPAFHQLIEVESARAEQFYREGYRLLAWLAPAGRRIFGMITATYHALLEEIRRRPGEVFVRRVRVGWPKKLAIAARWTFLPPAASPQRTTDH
jgi:phytoene synthase